MTTCVYSKLKMKLPAFCTIHPGVVNDDFDVNPESIVPAFFANLFFFNWLVLFFWFFPGHF